jgi:hypothetical protein
MRPVRISVCILRSAVVGVLAVLVSAGTCAAQGAPATRTDSGPVATKHELLHKYVWATLGGPGALHATLAASFEQWRGAPPEWGTGREGYAKRWASEFAEAAVADTTKYAVARLLHHDPSFTRCDCTGFGPRLGHALSSPFMARTRHGRRVLSPATAAGLVAGHVIPAATWYPTVGGTRDGFEHAASSLVAKMAVDVVREFVSFHRN